MIEHLDGNELADSIMGFVGGPLCPYRVTLAVKGKGPFLRQIKKMADGTRVDVVEGSGSNILPRDDVDAVTPQSTHDFFTKASDCSHVPCVVAAIYALIVKYCDPYQGITVLGRGRFGAFTATFLARHYGQITWQTATEPAKKPGIIVNCSREAPKSYPDGSTVIDINKIGRLTTAILLLRTLMSGHGEIELV